MQCRDQPLPEWAFGEADNSHDDHRDYDPVDSVGQVAHRVEMRPAPTPRAALCHAGPVTEWVLFLGAGASVSAPTRLPAFPSLARGVLAGVGWRYRNGSWRQKGFPTFVDPGRVISPEVLFGTLQAYEVDFAPKIADVLDVDRPNAAHRVAAAVIESGGMVWTTNVDLAVEAACRQRGLREPPRFGRQTPRRQERRSRRNAGFEELPKPPLLAPLIGAGPGGLVKFHGTAEDPTTLAFTDRELMTPLADKDAEHLARQVKHRTLVLYGYAGADADLADVLELAIDRADRVLWFEPSLETRDAIGLFFPTVGDGLVPTLPDEVDAHDLGQTVPPTARAFLETARLDGYMVDDDDDPPFAATQESPPDPEVDIGSTPGIMSARLVERFGPSSEELHALFAALRRDLLAWRWSLFPAYARWTFSRSLYNHGIAARMVRIRVAVSLAVRVPWRPSVRQSHHLAKVRPSPHRWRLAGDRDTGRVVALPPASSKRHHVPERLLLPGVRPPIRAATRGRRGRCGDRRPGAG